MSFEESPNPHGGRVHALASRLGLDPDSILDFSASINPLGPPEGAVRAITANLHHLLVNYPPATAGALKSALAEHMGIDPDRLLVGNGSTQLIHALPLLKAGGRALLVEPSFAEYRLGLQAHRWTIEAYVWNQGATLDGLTEQLGAGYDLAFIGQPTNPCGRLSEPEELLNLARAMNDGGYLVVDQAFIDFCPEASILPHMTGQENIVILGSLTKYYALPGLRLGYLIAPEPIIRCLASFIPPWSVNGLAQTAALECLADQEYGLRTRAENNRRKKKLAHDLSSLGLTVYPGAANYLMVGLPSSGPRIELLSARLEERAILIRDCSNYMGISPGHFRVSVRSQPENDRLVSAMAEIMATV